MERRVIDQESLEGVALVVMSYGGALLIVGECAEEDPVKVPTVIVESLVCLSGNNTS